MTVDKNYPLLHQNGTIVWIRRNSALLPTEGRPLSQAQRLEDMERIRRPMYEAFADAVIDNDTTVEDAVQKILELLEER